MPQFRLDPGDPAPFELMRRDAASSLLLTCDHASKDVPHALKQLGLAPAELQRHIGWDIGAAAVTRRLAPLLDAPAILAGYSRLVIDCNRDPGDPSSIPEASDGTAIPGNHGLGAEERALRHAAIFAPYHGAIEDWLETRIARGVAPALLSIHSFTPVMCGFARPWHVGVLWD
ncbi:MAG TPA: N-formylglutamate amidohydrolase, partial [Stellaceae bacterium]|nr:N-formylglutamate amidohydrolase [Stellaceae bacterium]